MVITPTPDDGRNGIPTSEDKLFKPFCYDVLVSKEHTISGRATVIPARQPGSGGLQILLKEPRPVSQLPVGAYDYAYDAQKPDHVTMFLHEGSKMSEGQPGSISFEGFNILKRSISGIYEVGTTTLVW